MRKNDALVARESARIAEKKAEDGNSSEDPFTDEEEEKPKAKVKF